MAWLAVTRHVATTTARDPVIIAPKLSLTSSIKQCTTKPNPTTAVQSSMLPWQPLLVLIHFLLQPCFEKLLLQKTAPKKLMETQLVCIHFKDLHMTSSLAVLDVHFYTCQCSRHNKDELSNSAFSPFKQHWKRNAVLFILTKVNSEIVWVMHSGISTLVETKWKWKTFSGCKCTSAHEVYCMDEAFNTLWPHQIDGSVVVR